MIILILIFLFIVSIAFGTYNLLRKKSVDELTISELLFLGVSDTYDHHNPSLLVYAIFFPILGIVAIIVVSFKVFHKYIGKRTLSNLLKVNRYIKHMHRKDHNNKSRPCDCIRGLPFRLDDIYTYCPYCGGLL